MNTLPDKFAIACNFAEPTSECAPGALAFVIDYSSASESMDIYARSRSGRWIRKWERVHRLKNFRVKTIPPENPKYLHGEIFLYDEADIEKLATRFTELAESLRRRRARPPE